MTLTKENISKGRKFYQDLIQKSWEDNTFKEQLIKNPVETIEKFNGFRPNQGNNISIVVEDQGDENTIYLNIPAKFDIDSLELSDEDLDTVSGGTDFFTGVVVGICIVYTAWWCK